MSFWTGFTTGLASSVDRGLQKAIERRDGELSRAKEFWMQRKATKLEKAEEEKAAYDKKAEKAYNRLADELGDTTMAYAAFQKLGGADEALDYLSKVDEARGKLQPGQTYNIADDFVDYKAGKTTLTRAEGLESVRMQLPSLGTVSASDLAIDDKLGRLFGREGRAAEQAAASINKRFAEFQGQGAAAPTDIGTIGRVDLSRQVAAVSEKERQEERELDIQTKQLGLKSMTLDMDAKKLGMTRTQQAIQLDADAAKLAEKKFLSAEEQREIDNKRAEAESLRRQTELIMKSEKHVLDMESAGLTIEEQKREADKAKEFPEFASFEKAIVYANTQLARSDLSDQERSDLEKLSEDMTAAAIAYNNQVENEGGEAIEFSKQSLDSIIQGAQNFELKNVPSESIGDKIQYKIEGNEAQYFAGMERALNAVTKRLTPEGGTMPAQAQRYIDELKSNTMQRAFDFAKSQESKYTQAGTASAQQRAKYVPLNVVQGAVEQIKAQNQGMSDAAAMKQYASTNLKSGTVVPMNDEGTLYGIWTGTRFIKAQARQQ